MPIHAVVLAAGLGTRMKSPLAKVLHPLLGRPMVGWVVEALREAGADVTVVVNHQEEAVRAALPGCAFARQEAPRGTGDAVRSALAGLPAHGPVLVTAGDTPLVTAEAFRRLLDAHEGGVTVAAFEVADPTGYGRMIAGKGIVEHVDCSPAEREVRLVNSGVYVFDADVLHAGVPTLRAHPPKDELYLTDLVGPGAKVVRFPDASIFAGVNDRAQLADARAALRRRVNRAWALAGVDFEDLDRTHVDVTVELLPDARVGFGTQLLGRCRVAGEVGPHCVVRDATVEAGARVHAGSHVDCAVVGPNAVVGPMARLRPGAVLEEGVHVGNFVEVKQATLRKGAKANHLAYLGDADVGEGTNVGAGTITCNYDGFAKHRTQIGARVFIGSNTALVAPIRVGDGAYVAAGSTLTTDVPEEALAIARGSQVNKPGLAERLRQRARARAGRK
ncbi:MAG: bifunctional UDP-N-acetylglucosamine diphosphorylase/glucosamine-1-phosphate N-acetyltransferase GlmU [Myxococcota bacterium]